MLNNQRGLTSNNTDNQDHEDQEHVRDIHALTPPRPPHRSLSMASNDGSSTENFTTMSREFSALVLAGSAIGSSGNENDGMSNGNNLGRIGEEELPEETNPLAIVPDNNPSEHFSSSSPPRHGNGIGVGNQSEVSVQRVKKEEIESKINAWKTAKIAKINNRFKREAAIINGWENEQINKSSSWIKKIERKLEEKRARALEKMQNDIAKARRKAEERRASAEAKRGTKLAQILETANLMRAVGRPPVKRSFF